MLAEYGILVKIDNINRLLADDCAKIFRRLRFFHRCFGSGESLRLALRPKKFSRDSMQMLSELRGFVADKTGVEQPEAGEGQD